MKEPTVADRNMLLKRTASGTLIHCEATNPVPQQRLAGWAELRRIYSEFTRSPRKSLDFNILKNGQEIVGQMGFHLIELLRLLVHRTFYSLVFWYTNNLQYEILISHEQKHLWFWDIMGERLEYSIPVPFFFEIPDLGPPKTQRVFWVKPSFSSSTLRKTNMYTIL